MRFASFSSTQPTPPPKIAYGNRKRSISSSSHHYQFEGGASPGGIQDAFIALSILKGVIRELAVERTHEKVGNENLARGATERSDQIARLVDRADISDVATALGIQVDRRMAEPRKAICPFHDDKDPSLSLYRGGRGDRSHYHCYVCGAHGDAIRLVQAYENLDFIEAVVRLAQIMGEDLDLSNGSAPDQRLGSAELVGAIRQASPRARRFTEYATARGFDPKWLHDADVAVLSMAPLVERARRDRVLEETLVAAGVVRRRDESDAQELWRNGLSGFFGGDRLVFQINDIRGNAVGFAARALHAEAKPKYLYSYGFPRRKTLYRADVVASGLVAERQSSAGKRLDLYIVEGLFDALRLEALGLNAVAVLGARITSDQIDVLRSLVALAANNNRELHLHLFFDRDEAGRLGAYDATLALLNLLGEETPFNLDVAWPADKAGSKLDPDAALIGLNADVARSVLERAAVSPLAYLASHALSADPHAINWESFPRLKRAAAARAIARALPPGAWDRINAALDQGEEDPGLAQFTEFVDLYANTGTVRSRRLQTSEAVPSPSDSFADLLTALTLARSSSSRREYPSDDASWDRLATAASTAFHLHELRLRRGDGPAAPLLARELPKGGGRYRLKRGPVAEDALIQQYVLIELLRERPECPDFEANVPAIRYAPDRLDGQEIYCTGHGREAEAVSFAYQIDMAIVNGLAPPRREGPFRPYFDCWRAFIDFVESKIKAFHYDELQILRLDITGFYDNIRRDAVEDSLVRPLASALASLGAADGGVAAFAPLLKPDAVESAEGRAEATTSFLLSHAFGMDFLDPKTGVVLRQDPLKGIPQGPDLSAYLANISLFELDAMMRREVAQINAAISSESACGAAYARYVDDIVLICADVETASQLRRKIEAHLSILGLSLNRKNATPPPMTREEARAWITDNRAGFGFSGPLADLPTTDAMDPLAEAGDIDRKTALGMIYDPELDNPENAARALSRIAWALQTPDLRYNDRASAYRRLWSFAVSGVAQKSAAEVAADFLDLVRQVDPAVQLTPHGEPSRDSVLACLDGLDRALRAVVPQGTLSDAACDDLAVRKRRLASAVLGDVFTPLVETLVQGQEPEELLRRYDVRTQIGVIAQLAAEVIAMGGGELYVDLAPLRKHINGLGEDTPLFGGLLASLRRYDQSVIVPRPISVTRANAAGAAFTRLHGAIVQLQRLGRNGGTDEELQPLSDEERADPDALVSAANKILNLWSPIAGEQDAASPPTQLDLDAAATLVNLTHRRFAEVVTRRPHLLRIIAGQANAKALPSPPGLQSHGILLWCPEGRLLLARPENIGADPVGVSWTSLKSAVGSAIVLKQADLPPGCHPLYIQRHEWSPNSIAKTYRAFFPVWRRLDQDPETAISIPTVFSYFARVLDDGTFADLRMVAWTAAPATVDGHAFVRIGDALEARSVFSDGADFWRYGWSIRDLCERNDLPGDDEEAAEAHAAASLERATHRREAIVSRVLPRLSGADRWGPGEVRPGSLIPSRIERGLRLLEQFGLSSVAADAAYLVAAIGEGLFMSERVNGSDQLSVPGAPASLLMRATRRTMRALPEAAAHWAGVGVASAPYRRTAVAWFTVAERLRANALDVAEVAEGPLRALALGAELLGVTADLRSLAFELAGGLDAAALERLASAQIDQGWLHDLVGLDLLLVEAAETVDATTGAQTRLLVALFREIVVGRRLGLRGLRDQISPAGWAVLVAVLLQVIVVGDDAAVPRPGLWPMDSYRLTAAQHALTTLLKSIAVGSIAGHDSETWPWDAFAELQAEWSSDVASALRDLTEAAALVVTTHKTWVNPRSDDSPVGRQIVRLPDGTSIALAEWQVDIAHIRGEKGIATETRDIEGRLEYVYSLSRYGDRLLGLHLVSRQLATTAFGGSPTTVREPDAPQRGDGLLAPSAIAGQAEEAEFAVELDPPSPDASAEGSGATANLLLEEVRAAQRRAWKARADRKAFGRQRIALLQWDVTDTYTAPGAKDGSLEGLLGADGAQASSEQVKLGGSFISTTEHRRRAILKAALSACVDFGVDGLVLPEYSLRPETVNWLARQLKQAASPIAIWCGTFRIPGGTQLDYEYGVGSTLPFRSANGPTPVGRVRFDDHTALLTCLRVPGAGHTGEPVRFAVRRKRYPSAAAGELIRPPINDPWQPLLSDGVNPFDIASFAIELICSEMFPHASSANFVGIIDENERLAQRYGISPSVEEPFTYLSKDVFEFAKWTSHRNSVKIAGDTEKYLWRGRQLQRTLIVLPAMTTRTADYHIFGQNQYLAAGLVTAFCNAVEPHYSCGESCFIGLDAWRETEPPTSPYGKVAPGIFQIGAKVHSGPLGRREAAMVIADLDLLRTTDQKPRPHYQDRALELVAHLPLIFQTELTAATLGEEATKGQRRSRLRKLPAFTAPVAFDKAVSVIHDALLKERYWQSAQGTLQAGANPGVDHSVAVSATDAGLETIEVFSEHSEWATARRKAFHHDRFEIPYPSPCPALVDWIYVDDRWLAMPSAGAIDLEPDPLISDEPRLTVPKHNAEIPRKPS